MFFGLNKNDIPIIKDVYKLTNANGAILATSGSGKSFFTKLLLSRHLLNDVKVMIIDPQSEYIKLVKKFNGEVIDISKDSNITINPLDLMGHDYAEKRLSLMDLMPVMLGEVSEIQKATIDRALTSCYEKKGITNDDKTWNNQPPILEDLLNELISMSKKATIIEKPTYSSLINRLSMYTTGVFSFLNKYTKIDFNNQFVCFNIGEMPKQVKPTIMFLVLDYVYMKMKETRDKKILVIDEAWSLLNKVEEASYIFEIVKTSRKFNLGLLLITQDVADLLKSEAGNALLANSSYTILMRQKAAVIDDISRVFKLSRIERDKLLTANIGEGILILENEHSELKVIASDEEYKIVTTNPNDYIKKPRNVQEQKIVQINVDEQEGFFEKSKLTREEIEFLIKKGYSISSHVGLDGGGQIDYLLKPRHNETSPHFFLVKSIENYIKNFTQEVQTYETVKPDIVFIANGKKIAVEVETGVTVDKRKDLLLNKINMLNSDYDEWFFVLTNKYYRYKYGKYGRVYVRTEIPDLINSYFGFLALAAPRNNTSPIIEETGEVIENKAGGIENGTKRTTKKRKTGRDKQTNTGNKHKPKRRWKVDNTHDKNSRHKTS